MSAYSNNALVTYRQYALPLMSCGFCSEVATSHTVAEGHERKAGVLHCKDHEDEARDFLMDLLLKNEAKA